MKASRELQENFKRALKELQESSKRTSRDSTRELLVLESSRELMRAQAQESL